MISGRPLDGEFAPYAKSDIDYFRAKRFGVLRRQPQLFARDFKSGGWRHRSPKRSLRSREKEKHK